MSNSRHPLDKCWPQNGYGRYISTYIELLLVNKPEKNWLWQEEYVPHNPEAPTIFLELHNPQQQAAEQNLDLKRTRVKKSLVNTRNSIQPINLKNRLK